MNDRAREKLRARIFRRRPTVAAGATNIKASNHVAGGRSGPTSRWWLFLLLCLLGSTAASFVIFKYVAPSVVAPSIPSELIGTWQVVDGDLKGATLEFTWHGTAVATSYKHAVKEVTQSSVKIEGKRIILTTEDPATHRADTVVQTIVNLTDNELVIRDEDKNTYRMIRSQR
jgi:uncharacterized protein (TIGR03066 family)